MTNDIVTTVGKGNGSFLVLLDLPAAFDTIHHDNLFYILEKYVGISGNALRLIGHILVIVHKEFKLMVLCLILLVVWGATGFRSGTNEILFVFASTWCDT